MSSKYIFCVFRTKKKTSLRVEETATKNDAPVSKLAERQRTDMKDKSFVPQIFKRQSIEKYDTISVLNSTQRRAIELKDDLNIVTMQLLDLAFNMEQGTAIRKVK